MSLTRHTKFKLNISQPYLDSSLGLLRGCHLAAATRTRIAEGRCPNPVRTMKNRTGFIVVALGLFASSMAARAQQTKSFAEPESAPTIASVMEVQLRIVESQFVP